MKIGFFGDSYIDLGGGVRDHCWPKIVADSLVAQAGFHGQSGTSMWAAYEVFKRWYKKYDVIVFSFTSSSRWPCLPEELRGQEWNIGYNKKTPMLNQMNPFFFSLFSEDFLDFVNSSIHRNVVEMCERDNKYLIQVIPFLQGPSTRKTTYDFTPIPSKFPLISGLNEVSHMEHVMFEGKRVPTSKTIGETDGYDHRACHLNPSNNRIVAEWITDCIREKKYNVAFECKKSKVWTVFDQEDSDLFNARRRK